MWWDGNEFEKAAGKDKIKGEMINSGGDRVVDWIWRLCNMVFVPVYKGKL